MSILEPSQDGKFLFVALEDSITLDQMVFKITRPTSTTPTVVMAYEPTGGSNSANVAPTGNPDKMLFHGDFDEPAEFVMDHAIAAGTNTDIGNGGIAEVLRVDPSDDTHIILYDQDQGEIQETEDNGSSWTVLNIATGSDPIDAMDIVFFGNYFPAGGFIGGNDVGGPDEVLEYTPNNFANLRDDTSAALAAVGSIASIDIALGT
jgi:hypothetical protein